MNLKEKLANNELTVGTWITIGHPSVVEILSTAGFDWMAIDIEHAPIDFSMVQTLIATIQAKGMKALVRVSKNEEVVIKRVLDSGADGIVVPMIKNANDAKQAVEYVKYPPIGKRGVGLSRAQNFGIGFENYKSRVENELVVIAQIEHIDAVNNLEEIISTPGIDGTMVGPYDLSGSMGKPGKYYDDDVVEALVRVKKVCLQNQFPLGFHVIESNIEKLNEKIAEGYTFLAFSLDFFFLGDTARSEMNKIIVK